MNLNRDFFMDAAQTALNDLDLTVATCTGAEKQGAVTDLLTGRDLFSAMQSMTDEGALACVAWVMGKLAAGTLPEAFDL